MYTKEITFEDLDGNQVTEVYHFNLNKQELIELELETEGLKNTIEAITSENDSKKMVELFKMLINKTYGVRDPLDNKRFKKSPELLEAFQETDAYSELFIELATNAEAASDFVNGVLPKSLLNEAKKNGYLDENGRPTEKATSEITPIS